MTLKVSSSDVKDSDVSVTSRKKNIIKQENLHHKMIPDDQHFSYSASNLHDTEGE